MRLRLVQVDGDVFLEIEGGHLVYVEPLGIFLERPPEDKHRRLRAVTDRALQRPAVNQRSTST